MLYNKNTLYTRVTYNERKRERMIWGGERMRALEMEGGAE